MASPFIRPLQGYEAEALASYLAGAGLTLTGDGRTLSVATALAGAGLLFSAPGVLAVGAGNGIAVDADAVRAVAGNGISVASGSIVAVADRGLSVGASGILLAPEVTAASTVPPTPATGRLGLWGDRTTAPRLWLADDAARFTPLDLALAFLTTKLQVGRPTVASSTAANFARLFDVGFSGVSTSGAASALHDPGFGGMLVTSITTAASSGSNHHAGVLGDLRIGTTAHYGFAFGLVRPGSAGTLGRQAFGICFDHTTAVANDNPTTNREVVFVFRPGAGDTTWKLRVSSSSAANAITDTGRTFTADQRLAFAVEHDGTNWRARLWDVDGAGLAPGAEWWDSGNLTGNVPGSDEETTLVAFSGAGTGSGTTALVSRCCALVTGQGGLRWL